MSIRYLVLLLTGTASVMRKLFKGNNPHKLCPVFKATMVLVFKNIERDLPLSIK